MSRYADILNKGKNCLREAHIDDFQTDGWLLFEYVFEMDRTHYLMRQTDENTDTDKENRYFSLIEKRCTRVPLQHITGFQSFMGFDFVVNKHTLIPRQDTEVLVMRALEAIAEIRKNESSHMENADKRSIKILDMCTGSGCIAVSIARLAPGVQVTAADISEEALAVARENGIRLGVCSGHKGSTVLFKRSSLFDDIDDGEKYDIIVSNPPYIRTKDIEELSDEVRLHDPFIALDGREDGLHFYREITEAAEDRLKNGGYLLYETGFDQAAEVSDIMRRNGYDNIEVIKDMAGLDRVVAGRRHYI